MMFPWCVANDDKMDQSVAIFPCNGISFLCLPSTAGYDAMHGSNGTGIDGGRPSVSKTNRLDTGLKNEQAEPDLLRIVIALRGPRGSTAKNETVRSSDKRCATVEGALRTHQGVAKAGNP
jgi:hypothetical protein